MDTEINIKIDSYIKTAASNRLKAYIKTKRLKVINDYFKDEIDSYIKIAAAKEVFQSGFD
jgi:nucleoid-associated protein YejK